MTNQLWHLFLNIVGLQWMMPSNHNDLLSSWNKSGTNKAKQNGEMPSLLAFGGQLGEEGKDVLKANQVPSKKIKMICSLLFCFLVQRIMKDDEQF